MFAVVLPLYNKGATVSRALASVAAQTDPPAEVIVVNDGSTDGGEAVAARCSLPGLRLVTQANQGVSCARNAGVALATQPYVAFLDADDEWRPDHLQRMRDAVLRFPGAGLYGAGFETVAGGRTMATYRVGGRDARVIDFFAHWRRRHVFHISSAVLPVAALQAVGGFTPGVGITEDAELFYRIAMRYPVVALPSIGARYDVAVPGQAIEHWRREGAPDFRIQRHHQFLAEAPGTSGATGASFRQYCRSEFRTALRGRLLWGDLAAFRAFYRMANVRGALPRPERLFWDAIAKLPAGGRVARALRRLRLTVSTGRR